MKIAISGGAGFLGLKLAERLARDGQLGGHEIAGLTLHDVVAPRAPAGAGFPVTCLTGDIAAPGETDRLIAGRPDVVFHLAAIVSGEAEQEFDKGYRINLTATHNLLESLRKGYAEATRKPRLVFTSSIAVFGAPFPETIPDEFHLTPLTSYGTQKAMGELLLSDYTRKGLVDGIGIRLPTICIRPGTPNKAASGFFSNICREPLAGHEAVLPVSEDVRHSHASPRAAIGYLLRAATIDGREVGPRRNLSMPGLSLTVGEQIAALRRVAGEAVVKRIRREPDPFIAKIVAGWPSRFDPKRALALGFRGDNSFDDIIRAHIEDELGGRISS
ncbi:MAG: D-erythronate dehydrogenase [Hyphomicrobiaceae bacterium]